MRTSPGGTDMQIFFGDNCSSLSTPQRTARRMLLPRPVIETLCAALGSTTGVSRNVLVTPSLFTSVTSQPSFVRLKLGGCGCATRPVVAPTGKAKAKPTAKMEEFISASECETMLE